MGEVIRDYRGHLLVYHTGGLQGLVSIVAMLPELHLGVVVLTNQESDAAFQSIAYTVLDHYLDAPPKDWVTAMSTVVKRNREEAEKTVTNAAAKRDKSSKPSLPLEAYTGRYRDPWYGDVLIEKGPTGLRIRFTHSPKLEAPLEHWQQDTFVAHWPDRSMDADAYITFALNPDGTIESAKMQPVSPLTDFSFDFQHLALKRIAMDATPW
jgi:hypothetical protein